MKDTFDSWLSNPPPDLSKVKYCKAAKITSSPADRHATTMDNYHKAREAWQKLRETPDTGHRTVAEQIASIRSQNRQVFKGWFASEAALIETYPRAARGDYAIVTWCMPDPNVKDRILSGADIWVWDPLRLMWSKTVASADAANGPVSLLDSMNPIGPVGESGLYGLEGPVGETGSSGLFGPTGDTGSR